MSRPRAREPRRCVSRRRMVKAESTFHHDARKLPTVVVQKQRDAFDRRFFDKPSILDLGLH